MFALLIKERNLHNLAKREGRMMGKDGRGPLPPSLSVSFSVSCFDFPFISPTKSFSEMRRRTDGLVGADGRALLESTQ